MRSSSRLGIYREEDTRDIRFHHLLNDNGDADLIGKETCSFAVEKDSILKRGAPTVFNAFDNGIDTLLKKETLQLSCEGMLNPVFSQH